MLDEYPGYEEAPDKKPVFSFPLRSRYIQEGSGFKLICSVDAKPPPKVRLAKRTRTPVDSSALEASFLGAHVRVAYFARETQQTTRISHRHPLVAHTLVARFLIQILGSIVHLLCLGPE